MTVPLSAVEEDSPNEELDDEENPDSESSLNRYRTPTSLSPHAAFRRMLTPASEIRANGRHQTNGPQPGAATNQSRSSNASTSEFRLPQEFNHASLSAKDIKLTFLWPGGLNRRLTFEEDIQARRSIPQTTIPAEDVVPDVKPSAADVQVHRYMPLTREAL